MRIVLVGTLLAASACSQSAATDSGSNTDVVADAVGELPPSSLADCGPSRIDFTYQFPDAAPQTGCAAMDRGVLVYYDRSDAGACTAASTAIVADSVDYAVTLGSMAGAIFSTAGTYPIQVQFEIARDCDVDASLCLYTGPVGSCSVQVTAPGTSGAAAIQATLAAPCMLPNATPGAQPASVQLLSMTVNGGPVSALTNGQLDGGCP